jgi:hypothetical protein
MGCVAASDRRGRREAVHEQRRWRFVKRARVDVRVDVIVTVLSIEGGER